MCGDDKTPSPSKTKDCKTPVDKTKATCKSKDDEIKLVRLREVYKHKGAWKEREVDSRRQFINLDDKVDAAKDHPEFGRAVRLKAQVQWVSGDKSRSLAGKTVYWYSKGDSANNAKLTKAQQESFDSAGAQKKKKTAPTDKDGWTQPLPFYLSLYGGDKFEVYATLDSAYKGGLKAGPYRVWRKFWFQVSEMKDRAGTGKFAFPAQASTAITNGYKKAKIEFTEKGPRGNVPHHDNLQVNGIPSGATGMRDLGRKHFVKDDRVPFKCHLMTCDYAGFSTEDKPVADSLTSKTWTSPSWYKLWPHGGSLAWKIEAKYKDGKTWKDIPAAKLSSQSHGSQPGFKKVKIDFSSGPVTPSAKSPVQVKLKVKCTKGGYLGWGGGTAQIVLCSGYVNDFIESAKRAPSQSRTSVHEIGHALGLVNMVPAAAKAHDAWEDKTHSNHCNKKATECAMYWQNVDNRVTTFHSIGGQGCNEHLRTQDNSRSVMKPLWK